MVKGKAYFVNSVVIEDGIKMLHVKSSETQYNGVWKYNMFDLIMGRCKTEWIPMEANLYECKLYYCKNLFTDWEKLNALNIEVEYELCEKGLGYKSAKAKEVQR